MKNFFKRKDKRRRMRFYLGNFNILFVIFLVLGSSFSALIVFYLFLQNFMLIKIFPIFLVFGRKENEAKSNSSSSVYQDYSHQGLLDGYYVAYKPNHTFIYLIIFVGMNLFYFSLI